MTRTITVDTIDVRDVPEGIGHFEHMGIRHPANLDAYLVESDDHPPLQGMASMESEAERAYRYQSGLTAGAVRVRMIISAEDAESDAAFWGEENGE